VKSTDHETPHFDKDTDINKPKISINIILRKTHAIKNTKLRPYREQGEKLTPDFSSVARTYAVFVHIILRDHVKSSYSQLILLSAGSQIETATWRSDKERSNIQKMGVLLCWYFGSFTSEGKNFITNLLNSYLLNLSVANHIDWNYLVEGSENEG
jgi:hypothetical protein